VSVLRGTLARFFAADGFFLAGGLAFFFLVCIIPLLLLSISILGFVLSAEQAQREVVAHLARNFPVYQREITRVLLRIVETRTVSGLLGTAILVLFSMPLFSAARLVMHRLLGVPGTSGFFRNMAGDAVMALTATVLLFGATVAAWALAAFQQMILEPAHASAAWFHRTTVAFSVGLSVVLFYLGYRYLPRRRVHRGPALAAAIVAALLWELAKQLFRLYIRRVGVYDQIYGPLGILVAFVMFAYYSAIVYILGGAFAASLDSGRR
jgi:membrane protein